MTERLESDDNFLPATEAAADPDSAAAEAAADADAAQAESSAGETTEAQLAEEEQTRMAQAQADGEDVAGEIADAVAVEEATAAEEKEAADQALIQEGGAAEDGEPSASTVPAAEAESPAEETASPAEPQPTEAEKAPERAADQETEQTSAPAPAVPTPASAAQAPAASSAPAPSTPAPSAQLSSEQLEEARQFGEVDDDGSVHLLIDGEKVLAGQVPDVPKDEALAYFAKKFLEARTQVELLEQRVAAGAPAGDLTRSLDRVKTQLGERKLVGDVRALEARLEALRPRIKELEAEHRKAADAARAENLAHREAIVAEAEQISAQEPEKTQWKQSTARMNELFEAWQAHQKSGNRLSRKDEESLWKRFRGARTTFDRHRRAFFSKLDERNAEAKKTKQKLIAEAEALQSSTDWGPTSGKYRDLMDRWKAAPRAGRKDDDALWARFRAAQDVFFNARKEADKQVDREFQANLELKEALVKEARELLPVTDAKAARKKLSSIQARWEEIGKVPRGDFKRIENELGEVEDAVREADSGGRIKAASQTEVRSNAMTAQAEEKLADLQAKKEAAEAAGETAKSKKLDKEIESAQSMLEMIRRSAASL